MVQTDAVSNQIPLVDYLELGPPPRLMANECKACGARFFDHREACGARFFDHREACASCEGDAFDRVPVSTTGIVKAFTVVSLAAPGIPVPFVAAIVDCDGTSVRGNLVDVDASNPSTIELGTKVELTTTSVGVDSQGVEAVGFAFRPVES